MYKYIIVMVNSNLLDTISSSARIILGKDIVKVRSLSPHAQNKLFKVTTDTSDYFLKLYPSGSADERLYEINLLQNLQQNSHGFKFPQLYVAQVITIANMPALLFLFHSGTPITKADITHTFLARLAGQQATMHASLSAGVSGQKTRFNPLDFKFVDYFKLSTTDILINDFLHDLREQAKHIDESGMLTTVIHDDLSPDNVLIDEDKNITIVDFDDAHFSLRISDVGTAIKEFIIDPYGIDERLIKVYIDAYNIGNIYPITPTEYQALPYMIKRRALFMYTYYASQRKNTFYDSKLRQQADTIRLLRQFERIGTI